MVWLPNVVMANNGKLQATLDNLSRSLTRSTDDAVYDIDLSKMSDEDKLLTTTLEVRNGLHVRFINGTLTRTLDATGPMVRVTNSSTLEIGKDAIFLNYGVDHTPSSDKSTPNNSPVVSLLKGKVVVSENGKIEVDYKGSFVIGKEIDGSIDILDENCRVVLSGSAYIYNSIESSCESSDIIVSGGYARLIRCLGKSSNVVIEGGSISSIVSYSPINLKGGCVDRVSIFSSNIYRNGNIEKGSDVFELNAGSKINLTSALKEEILIYLDELKENKVVASGSGYQLTKADLAKVKLPQTDDYNKYNLVLESNDIVLKMNNICN